jgi:hypothetical protein
MSLRLSTYLSHFLNSFVVFGQQFLDWPLFFPLYEAIHTPNVSLHPVASSMQALHSLSYLSEFFVNLCFTHLLVVSSSTMLMAFSSHFLPQECCGPSGSAHLAVYHCFSPCNNISTTLSTLPLPPSA